MGIDTASKLMNYSQLSLAGTIMVIFSYFLIPTFVVLSVTAVIRRARINKKIRHANKNSSNNSNVDFRTKKQKKADKDFNSTTALENKLGDITEPTNKDRFSNLYLEFDYKGKAIRNGGNK